MLPPPPKNDKISSAFSYNFKSALTVIKGGKLSANVLRAAMLKVLDKWKKSRDSPAVYKGRQTVKQLVSQGAGVSNIEVTDKNIKAFDRVSRKYGIEYSLIKEVGADPQ